MLTKSDFSDISLFRIILMIICVIYRHLKFSIFLNFIYVIHIYIENVRKKKENKRLIGIVIHNSTKFFLYVIGISVSILHY